LVFAAGEGGGEASYDNVHMKVDGGCVRACIWKLGEHTLLERTFMVRLYGDVNVLVTFNGPLLSLMERRLKCAVNIGAVVYLI